MHWMIFGHEAVNMALVERMRQQPMGVVLTLSDRSEVRADGVTIDEILTALAAGQSRVAAKPAQAAEAMPMILGDGLTRTHARGRHRFREPVSNDEQAMRSIGRGT